VPEQLTAWVQKALDGEVRLLPLKADDGTLWGDGYEITRTLDATTPEDHAVHWHERVWVVRSQSLRDAQQRGLHQRLERAEAALGALTPRRGRGQRQFTEPEPLRAEVARVLSQYHVEDLLTVRLHRTWRDARCAPMATSPPVSPSSTAMSCNAGAMLRRFSNRNRPRVGGRMSPHAAPPIVAGARHPRLTPTNIWSSALPSFERPPLSLVPLWITREDHAIGLTRLLTLAARVLRWSNTKCGNN